MIVPLTFGDCLYPSAYVCTREKATRYKTGKCKRKVRFILDEFGNLPAIQGMDKFITVCLGRNIAYDLYIQAYSQVEQLYGKAMDTIVGNCGNQIYILTNDDRTAENFQRILVMKLLLISKEAESGYLPLNQ